MTLLDASQAPETPAGGAAPGRRRRLGLRFGLVLLLGALSAAGYLVWHASASKSSASDGWRATPYGFAAPNDWALTPLKNFGGPASFAYWRQPHGRGVVTYMENGGSAGILYANSDHPGAAEARDLVDCDLTTFQALTTQSFAFTCAAAHGLLHRGVIWVLDSPEGYRQVDLVTTDRKTFDAFPRHVRA